MIGTGKCFLDNPALVRYFLDVYSSSRACEIVIGSHIPPMQPSCYKFTDLCDQLMNKQILERLVFYTVRSQGPQSEITQIVRIA